MKSPRFSINSLTLKNSGIRGQFIILLVSDIHAHTSMTKRSMSAMSTFLADTAPMADLILYAGDFINNDSGIPLIKTILPKPSPDQHVFAVLGNHDHHEYPLWHTLLFPFTRTINRKPISTGQLCKVLSETGITVLEDSTVDVSVKGNRIRIRGISPNAFKEGCIPQCDQNKELFNLCFCHYPDAVGLIEKPVDLFCCGHTHGGRFRIGRSYLLSGTQLFSDAPFGLREHNHIPVVFSTGMEAGFFSRLHSPNGPGVSIITVQGDR